MNCNYKIRKDTVFDEENNTYEVYGIDAVETSGEREVVLESYSDIFFDKTKAEEFVTRCNEERLCLIHLKGRLENLIDS